MLLMHPDRSRKMVRWLCHALREAMPHAWASAQL